MVNLDIIQSDNAKVASVDQASWHLSAISNREISGAEYHHNPEIGEDTWGYVLDTGVRVTHSEFEGRAEHGFSAFDENYDDTAGHGTHVAGSIAGKRYGVTKKANIVNVKVFDGLSTTNDAILQGIEWAIDDIIAKNRTGKAVMNMSFGSGKNSIFNDLIKEGLENDIISFVAAGNEMQDVANVSPAEYELSFTVGAIQPDWEIWASASRGGSNFGEEINIMAPGAEITSAWIGSDTELETINGTSMATPHVAGLALYAISEHSITTAKELWDHLIDNGTPNVIGGELKGSPNLLANNGNSKQDS